MLKAEFESRAGKLREKAEEESDPEQASQLYRRSGSLYRKAAEKTENDEKASALNQLAEQLDREAEKALNRSDHPGQGRSLSYFSSPPDVDFSDVGGMEELKARLRDRVITQLQDTGFREDLGVSPTNGVLLYGPPGTGKTMVSKALAGEIGFHWAEVDTADLVSKYVGESAEQVQDLFREAVRVQPCVIFLDEIDALASPRGSGVKTDSEQQRVNQFLQSLDRIQGDDVLVIAATNLIEEVDSAFRRTGRFDVEIRVGLPDVDARRKILKVHLSGREHRVSGNEIQRLAERTDGFSGSDLEAVVEHAAQEAHIDSIEDDLLQPITYEHLSSAASQLASQDGGDAG
ncbi:ATP-binding protein [Haloarcula japonica]|uniref:ATP-binding protein n=1 Tax=Haloarcula japonica TaxID=29282 RepID=UPI0039F6CCEF